MGTHGLDHDTLHTILLGIRSYFKGGCHIIFCAVCVDGQGGLSIYARSYCQKTDSNPMWLGKGHPVMVSFVGQSLHPFCLSSVDYRLGNLIFLLCKGPPVPLRAKVIQYSIIRRKFLFHLKLFRPRVNCRRNNLVGSINFCHSRELTRADTVNDFQRRRHMQLNSTRLTHLPSEAFLNSDV